MILKIPQNLKFKKQKKKLNYKKHKICKVKPFFNNLRTLQSGFLTLKEVEACRKSIVRYTKKHCKLIINIRPTSPKTKKPLEVRMGKGKGSVKEWIIPIKRGQILFELQKSSWPLAYKAFKAGSKKLSIKTKICNIL